MERRGRRSGVRNQASEARSRNTKHAPLQYSLALARTVTISPSFLAPIPPRGPIMLSNRREFLHDTLAGSALMTLGSMSLAELRAAESPSQKISVGIMGTNGRGIELAKRY